MPIIIIYVIYCLSTLNAQKPVFIALTLDTIMYYKTTNIVLYLFRVPIISLFFANYYMCYLLLGDSAIKA